MRQFQVCPPLGVLWPMLPGRLASYPIRFFVPAARLSGGDQKNTEVHVPPPSPKHTDDLQAQAPEQTLTGLAGYLNSMYLARNSHGCTSSVHPQAIRQACRAIETNAYVASPPVSPVLLAAERTLHTDAKLARLRSGRRG